MEVIHWRATIAGTPATVVRVTKTKPSRVFEHVEFAFDETGALLRGSHGYDARGRWRIYSAAEASALYAPQLAVAHDYLRRTGALHG